MSGYSRALPSSRSRCACSWCTGAGGSGCPPSTPRSGKGPGDRTGGPTTRTRAMSRRPSLGATFPDWTPSCSGAEFSKPAPRQDLSIEMCRQALIGPEKCARPDRSDVGVSPRHHENGAGRDLEQVVRETAEERTGQRALAVAAEHDQVRVGVLANSTNLCAVLPLRASPSSSSASPPAPTSPSTNVGAVTQGFDDHPGVARNDTLGTQPR